MMTLREIISEAHPDALLCDGLDEALLGHDTKGRAVYSVKKIIGIFMKRDGMDEETAVEHFEFNVEQAYVGEKTPIYLCDYLDDVDLFM